MNVRRGLEATGAVLMSALAFAASTPNAHAANKLNPNQNPVNRLAKGFVKDMGRQLLRMTTSVGQTETISKGVNVSASGAASIEVTIDTGQSAVTGSNGEYNFSAFADQVGNNGLDGSDINSVRVAEGSSPTDESPLFALRLGTTHPHSHAPNEGGARFWYGAEGTAFMPLGNRVFFGGGVNPSRYDTPPGLVLDRTEIQATGQIMQNIIDAGLNGEPTQREDPPFGPLQHIG